MDRKVQDWPTTAPGLRLFLTKFTPAGYKACSTIEPYKYSTVQYSTLLCLPLDRVDAPLLHCSTGASCWPTCNGNSNCTPGMPSLGDEMLLRPALLHD